MTATFTFYGKQTLSKIFVLPISVQDIGEQFSIEPNNVFLIAETGHLKGRPIQPENAKFLELESGQKYEVVATSRDKCHFTYNGHTISMEPGKATPYYLRKRLCLKSVTLRQGEKTLSDVNGEFVGLTVGETYSVEEDRRAYDLQPKLTRKTKKSSCFIKLRVLVPPEMLKSIEGTLLSDFQTNANIRNYICLNKLFDRQAAANVVAKGLEKFRLRSEVPEFKTFFSAVAAINDATVTVFQDAHCRFDKIFINVMQLPKSLLDAIDVPNKFENNVAELREIMENTARSHINSTVALLQTEIDAIVSNFEKPLNLANKLCTTVLEQLIDDGDESEKIKTVLESKKRAHMKMRKEKDILKKGQDAEIERANFAEHSYDNAMRMPDEPSWTWFKTPQVNYETGKDIKLMALLEFVDAHVLEALPDIMEIDEHKWVNQGKYELLLSSVRSREPLVQTFRDYVAFLAELNSTTATNDDHTRLQHFHANLSDEAMKLHATMLKIDLIGTEKEKSAKAANCDKKVAMEKLQQYDQLICQKNDEIARITREIECKRLAHAHLSNELEALDSVSYHLKEMTRLFYDILTGLLITKECINTVLNEAIENFLHKLKLTVAFENETDARFHFKYCYAGAIQVSGWAVQIATNSLVFKELYAKVIEPALERNTDALYTGVLPQSSSANAMEVIEELERSIQEGAEGDRRTFFSAVSAINDATETVFQDIHHRFGKIFIIAMQLPKSLLKAIDVPNRFENNVAELREIMENPARKHIKATVALLQTEIETVFEDVHCRFGKIFINVMQLLKSLLEAIDVPNTFENNVGELREIMGNTARSHINSTVALLQTEIDAIVSNFRKPLDLANKLCTTVLDQLIDDGEESEKIKTVLESKERAHMKMRKEKDILKKGQDAELLRANIAENSYDNAMRMPDEPSWTWFKTPQVNYETGKDIKLMALLEFVDAHVLEALPDIMEIDEHKWVNQGKYELLLSSVRSREPLVQTFRDYVAFLAELNSTTATNDDHTRLQHFHANLSDEAMKLHATMLKIDLIGTEKEKSAKAANCDKKVAMEKSQQYDQLIGQKKDEIARITREIECERLAHAYLSNELDALYNVSKNLKQMVRLFNDILAGPLNTKEYINTVLYQVPY